MTASGQAPPAPVPVTRHALGRALVVNALTKPLNVGAGAAFTVTGIVIGVPWMIALGLVVYVALVVSSLLDGGETARLSKRIYGGERRPFRGRTSRSSRRRSRSRSPRRAGRRLRSAPQCKRRSSRSRTSAPRSTG